MADLSQTPANVKIREQTATISTVTGGEAITAGNAVVRRTGNKWYQAHADEGSSNAAEYAGSQEVAIALTGCSADGDPLVVAKRGEIDVGATLTVGEVYILSNDPGSIAPVADFQGYTGAYCTTLGVATATNSLDLSPQHSGANNIT